MDTTTITIPQGANLTNIASQYGTTVDALQQLNSISDPNTIYAGAQLKIPKIQNQPHQQTPEEPAVITSSSLKPQNLITVPQQDTTPSTTPPESVAEAALKTLDLTASEQSAQAGQENIIAKMLENITNQQGESQYRTDITASSGLAQKKQDLLNLDSQIRQKQAEIAQDDVTLVSKIRAEENRDTLLPFAQNAQAKLAGDAAIIRALKTSEIGVLNAQALKAQGDIQLAKDAINEAVEAKYAPYREQNALYEAQLKAIEPFLNSAEKKQALAQQTKLNLALKEIDRVSDFQKSALTNAISNNAPQSVLNKINSAKNIDDILKVGRQYLISPKEELELKKLRIDVNKSQADYLKTLEELQAAKQTLGGTTGDVTADLILGSSRYDGKQPADSWISDFTQAGVALGNVKELQNLIDKQGSTGLVSGNISSLFGKFSSNFANAAAINAQIQRTVPGLARGIFKEVGVLTDQDISNYKKTLPNLTSPEQQNKLALLATYDVIERSMALALANQAKAKNDVSGYYQDYLDVKNQVQQLKSELGFIETATINPTNKAKLDGAWNATFSPSNVTNTLNSFLTP